ncbi:MAG: DegT/DnrJ/EryC1/StrS family aminotransferase [Candidatus Omnitrophota bacterium]
MKKRAKQFVAWPFYGEEEIRAVEKVLRSGSTNQWTGNDVTEFEREYARYLDVRYCVALVNGSVALDVALAVLDIGPGDEVIVSPRTFVASASCIALRGAIPVFVDVDTESGNITVETVEKACTERTKAVIAVHLAGWPCELDELRDLCKKKSIYLIEDCAQGHGARYKGNPVGSYGDISCFSFCQDKIISTGGEGGLLATNDTGLGNAAWKLKDHGRDRGKTIHHEYGSGFDWTVDSFGTNYRMTSMQAAIGRILLRKLDVWVKKRRKLASILNKGLSEIPALKVTFPPEHIYHSYYKYYVYARLEQLRPGWSRDRILKEISKKGIVCGIGACPELYREKAFRRYFRKIKRTRVGRLKNAVVMGETSMMFQVHPTLTEENMGYMVSEISEIMKKAAK